ncbi:hypothetical protein [Chitinophaga pinensis]|uniref:Cytochrome B n=1 Tax=Chitinophaga pinensis (strain ATCC 43595 / DSM 2588 / LMG 13176 / NBRC 15968 / NCIMB 11800 / UQM 2034) TaxID=485918 RepID=A0A979GQB1_CHIPD|nr:hypothetical protein [Chitinophaga pinensis]ACU61237.1 conserved hypothetical protein [Chitinophaga pinensis DSM 2588]
MYFVLLVLHSLLRWLMLGSLCYAIYTAWRGVSQRLPFTERANAIRNWTTTISHIQLVIGMTIYMLSPLVNMKITGMQVAPFGDYTFFRYVHISLMILVIVLITIGSARAKRIAGDQEKYQVILRWFLMALAVLLIAIPWPFSPLAQRPWLRFLHI